MTAFSPLPWCALISMDSGSATCVDDSVLMGVGTVHAFLDFYLLIDFFYLLLFSRVCGFAGFSSLFIRFSKRGFFLVIVLISCYGVFYKGCIILLKTIPKFSSKKMSVTFVCRDLFIFFPRRRYIGKASPPAPLPIMIRPPC